jgi:hypothetical protein
MHRILWEPGSRRESQARLRAFLSKSFTEKGATKTAVFRSLFFVYHRVQLCNVVHLMVHTGTQIKEKLCRRKFIR